MPTLLTGPAGSGKTQAARQILRDSGAPTVAADFQSILAAILLLERREDGRYPERLERDSFALPLAEYLRRTLMTIAADSGVDVVVTNSDGLPARRKALLDALGTGAVETVIDPGIAVVRSRLAVNGLLSPQCEDALQRYYGRL